MRGTDRHDGGGEPGGQRAGSPRIRTPPASQVGHYATRPPKPTRTAAGPPRSTWRSRCRRAGPSAVTVAASATPNGTEPAAAAPCKHRPAIRATTGAGGGPQTAPTATPASSRGSLRRSPNRLTSRAPSITRPPKNIAVAGRDEAAVGARRVRLASMSGSAVTTTVPQHIDELHQAQRDDRHTDTRCRWACRTPVMGNYLPRGIRQRGFQPNTPAALSGCRDGPATALER